MYSAPRLLRLANTKKLSMNKRSSERFRKIFENSYELPMIVQPNSVFPGETFNVATSNEKGQSFISVNDTLSKTPVPVGTVCELDNRAEQFKGLRRVQILAHRKSGLGQIALVKNLDPYILRSIYGDDNVSSESRASVDYSLWLKRRVMWYDEDRVVKSSPVTITGLLTSDSLCTTIYKDFSTSLRLYRAFKWVKMTPPSTISLNRWDEVNLTRTAEFRPVAPAMNYRDISRITVLSPEMQKNRSIQNYNDEVVQLEERLKEVELDLKRPILNPLWESVDQPFLVQLADLFAARRSLLKIFFLVHERNSLLRQNQALRKEIIVSKESLVIQFQALMTVAHLYGDKDAETLLFATDAVDEERRNLIYRLCVKPNAFSYAVASQLKSLGAGISPARLQQYLEAPTTLARLTLLAADVAHIKAQLVQDALAKGVLTAEQVQQLETVGISKTDDLNHKEE